MRNRTLPDRPVYRFPRSRKPAAVPFRCSLCHEALPASWGFTRCEECLELDTGKKPPYRSTGQFTASGVDGTYLQPRVRGNPCAPIQRPVIPPARNMLPREMRRRG